MKALNLALSLALGLSLTGCAGLFERASRADAAASAARAVSLPEPVRVTLSNGLTLLVVERRNLPIVSVSGVIRAGEAEVAPRKSGLATMTAELLRRGTTTRSAPQIAESIESVGGSLETSAGVDSSTVGLSVLRKDLDLGLALLADVLVRPTFPEAEIKRLREEYQAALRASLDDADDVLRRAFTQELLAGHPYGTQSGLASLGAITRADVQQFYGRHYRPNNAFMAVVGDITPDEAKARFEKAFASWKPAPVPVAAASSPARADQRKVVFVEMPVNQSFIRLGNVAARRNTPDYFPLVVMNYILGGDFTSRLNQSIRDRQGLAYGAGSGLAMNVHGGYFFAGLNTKAESTGQALKSLLAEIDRLQTQPVTAAELTFAQDYLTGSFPLRFETNADLAREVVNMEFFGLPKDYLRTYRERVRAVTPADIQRVAREYLDDEAFTLVVVGQGRAVEEALASYGAVEKVERGNLIR